MKYRNLKLEQEDVFGNWRDESGQLYRWKYRDDEKILYPFWKNSPKGLWSSRDGYRRCLLILKLSGSHDKFYVLWKTSESCEMDEDSWLRSKNTVFSKVSVLCSCCDKVVYVTINSLRQGQRPGCKCHSTQLQHWRYRRDEFNAYASSRKLRLLTSVSDWKILCDGRYWCPALFCLICGTTFSQTSINGLQNGCVGCNCTKKLHYRKRRNEVVDLAEKHEMQILTAEDEWARCTGIFWKPTVKCLRCNMVCSSTSIIDILKGSMRCECLR